MNKKSIEKIKKINQENYENIAEKFSITRGYIWPDLKKLSNYVLEGYNVLDVGCGNGRLFEEFENKKVKYFGIDSCKKLIDIARNRYRTSPAKPQFGVFDIEEAPFKTEQFDAVFIIAVLNHFPSHKLQSKILKKINSLLKPNGLLLMTNWNLWRFTFSKKSWFYYTLQKIKTPASVWEKKYQIPKKELGLKDIMTEWKIGSFTYPLYYYAFSLNELNKLVKENNFDLIDSYYSFQGKKTSRFKGQNIITIARKK